MATSRAVCRHARECGQFWEMQKETRTRFRCGQALKMQNVLVGKKHLCIRRTIIWVNYENINSLCRKRHNHRAIRKRLFMFPTRKVFFASLSARIKDFGQAKKIQVEPRRPAKLNILSKFFEFIPIVCRTTAASAGVSGSNHLPDSAGMSDPRPLVILTNQDKGSGLGWC